MSVGANAAAAAALAAAAAARPPRVTGARAIARDLKQLSKARLSLLVALTASTGYVVGDAVVADQHDDGGGRLPSSSPSPSRAEWWRGLAATTAGTFLAAACANSLNQLYEARNDAAMNRTRLRPLPAGRLSPRAAALFALASGAAGVGLLWREAGDTAAALGAANVALYAGAYTPLKQVTVANTWVGAVVGAIPPLMGWAAAAARRAELAAADAADVAAAPSEQQQQQQQQPERPRLGAELAHPGAWVLALGLFSWQMPHFMALAWLCREDYRAGGFRMLSTLAPPPPPPPTAAVGSAAATAAGTGGGNALFAARELAAGRRVAAVGLRHSLALLPLGAAAAWLGLAEPGWHAAALTAEAGALAAAMVAASAAFYARPDAATARRAFRASLAYLPLLMLGMVVHRRREEAVATLPAGAEFLVAEGERGAAPLAAAASRAPAPSTWAGVRDRAADAVGGRGCWPAGLGVPAAATTMSVRLRLRSPEERMAGAVLARRRQDDEGQGQEQEQEEQKQGAAEVVAAAAAGRTEAPDLIALLRAALGLTTCPSRVYGEAVTGQEEEEEEEEEQGKEQEGGAKRRTGSPGGGGRGPR